jgi:HlyD family secretion protein
METITHTPRGPGLRRALVALASVSVVGAAAWYGVTRWTAEDPPTYATTEVRRGDVVQAVTASGTLSPVVQVDVGSQVSGRVKELFADYNDEVKKGQVIARIDPQVFESEVAQAQARLASARADLRRLEAMAANAKAQYERVAGLVASGAVARADVETAAADRNSAVAQVTGARAKITEAQGAVEQAKLNLAYTTITAPIDGVVISRSVDVGQTVAASLSAPVLFVIAGDLRQMEVHTTVAESDVGQLKTGMNVEFTVDAFPDKTFSGAVKQVRFEAQTVSNVVTYDAVVAVENASLELRPGMTANATFVIAKSADVLVAPSKALRFRPANAPAPAMRAAAKPTEGAAPAPAATAAAAPAANAAPADGQPKMRRGGRGGSAVWVLRAGVPVRVAVETGLSDGTSIEIKSGELKEGDLVITGSDTGGAAPAAPAAGGQRGNRSGGGMRGGPVRVF